MLSRMSFSSPPPSLYPCVAGELSFIIVHTVAVSLAVFQHGLQRPAMHTQTAVHLDL